MHFLPMKTSWLKMCTVGSSRCGTVLTNPTGIHEDAGLIPGLSQWAGVWCCCELWYRLQTWLGSHVAMAVVEVAAAALI